MSESEIVKVTERAMKRGEDAEWERDGEGERVSESERKSGRWRVGERWSERGWGRLGVSFLTAAGRIQTHCLYCL